MMNNMLDGFLSRWFKPCIGSRTNNEKPETSIESRNGNKRSHWLWQKKLARHLYGQYSMAVAQANYHNEDCCQLVSGNLTDASNGPRGVFVGVYDGHGGATGSRFVLDNLFRNLKHAIKNNHGNDVNPDVITEAYERTESSFVQYVRNNWQRKPELAAVGSCCLVGLVYNNVLYVANSGDSRAVLARRADGGGIELVQLSVDYNAKYIERRHEIRAEHPNVPGLFKCDKGTRLRGTLQVTRAIGDVYLKYNEFNCDPLPARFKQEHPIIHPILKAEPTVQMYQLGPDDRFVIFASDGLWDEIDNEQAVTLIRYSPRSGVADMLVREVMERAARRNELRYKDMRVLKPNNERRYFHDDISIVILYFDNLEGFASP